ncbi:Phytosulfokine [Macleaya cordata]|uniref:Phytosulfokine n=1 Tax=Macleaya cordata TaxID=56857 RepID=A0A200QJW1_MACCD|nr:Phytosulfokine [Macleaya cordata]
MSRHSSSSITFMLFMIISLHLILFFSLTNAARPQPVHPKDSSSSSSIMTTQNEDHDHQEEIIDDMDEITTSCEGVGEEECLMRRTLVAHTDYIYTQKKKNR